MCVRTAEVKIDSEGLAPFSLMPLVIKEISYKSKLSDKARNQVLRDREGLVLYMLQTGDLALLMKGLYSIEMLLL